MYKHFRNDGHSLEDFIIMPIEKVHVEDNDTVSITSKWLQREEYWYKELPSIYPCGLNDNVKSVGNMSKCRRPELVVFNNNERRYRTTPMK